MLLDYFQSVNPVVEGQLGTGIPVAQPFDSFYEAHGGERVLGYPVSDFFQELASDSWV